MFHYVTYQDCWGSRRASHMTTKKLARMLARDLRLQGNTDVHVLPVP